MALWRRTFLRAGIWAVAFIVTFLMPFQPVDVLGFLFSATMHPLGGDRDLSWLKHLNAESKMRDAMLAGLGLVVVSASNLADRFLFRGTRPVSWFTTVVLFLVSLCYASYMLLGMSSAAVTKGQVPDGDLPYYAVAIYVAVVGSLFVEGLVAVYEE